MFKLDYITKEDIKEHNPNWPEIPDHPYRILIVGGSVSEKTNALLNLINHEPDPDKIFSYAKDPYETKYQLLINILVVFDDIIVDMLSNKILNQIVTVKLNIKLNKIKYFSCFYHTVLFRCSKRY